MMTLIFSVRAPHGLFFFVCDAVGGWQKSQAQEPFKGAGLREGTVSGEKREVK